MNHQLAVVQTIFGLCIERSEAFARFTFTWHHADIVTANQRIEAGDAGKRGFWGYQPELGFSPKRIFHIAFDTGANLDFAAVAGKTNILYRADLNPLVAHRCAAGDNTVRRHKVDGDSGPPVFIAIPDKPARYQ